MKIAVDYQIFTIQAVGGISRYHVRLAQALHQLGQDIQIMAPVARNRYLRGIDPALLDNAILRDYHAVWVPMLLPVNRKLSDNRLRRFTPEILHETYYCSTAQPCPGATRLVTVHDMIAEQYPQENARGDHQRYSKRTAVQRADHIIAISHATKRSLCGLFDIPDSRVTVIHHGVEALGTQGSIAAAALAPQGRPYLLYVGNRQGYKNFARLVQTVASRPVLRRDFDVIAFGGGPLRAREFEQIRGLGLAENQVRQLDGNDTMLASAYRHAAAFVFPSLVEGFGMPPLEAMACDCPVVSSNTSAMPEVVGDAGEYFDPLDVDALGLAVERVVLDAKRRQALVQAGRARVARFTWQACAEATLGAYRTAFERHQ